MAVRITHPYREGSKELIVASVYLPYDSDEPPQTKEMSDIIDYCFSRKRQLIIGCDANAHHILWGSTGTNPRGESLMEFPVSSNLNILNHGNEPMMEMLARMYANMKTSQELLLAKLDANQAKADASYKEVMADWKAWREEMAAMTDIWGNDIYKELAAENDITMTACQEIEADAKKFEPHSK
ncbi:hypothetical protein B7P43_G18121 [Cryptotermes secundus]|uniref:Endonuclease/exonuclease/phosphatase domain-containing protein n=1 Tax=Cryptotermes secundus TaxID=105785 RepID=A0A2J7PTI8_9NEOP|nr:hypothetical protein B7P43_G18121 [Cryptotermes secundus]